MTCSVVDGQGKRGNVHIPAIMSVDFPDVVVFDGSFSCGIVYSRGNRTPESEKKQTSAYLIKRKMKKKILVYVPGRYISLFVVLILIALAAGVNSNPSSREVLLEDGKSERTQTVAYMADTKRAAAHRRPGPERGVAAYRRTPEREQTILIGWPSDIGRDQA